MMLPDNDFLSSLNNSEIKCILESIGCLGYFFDTFSKGTPVKFESHDNDIRVFVFGQIEYGYKWIWYNSLSNLSWSSKDMEDFHIRCLDISRKRKLNSIGIN